MHQATKIKINAKCLFQTNRPRIQLPDHREVLPHLRQTVSGFNSLIKGKSCHIQDKPSQDSTPWSYESLATFKTKSQDSTPWPKGSLAIFKTNCLRIQLPDHMKVLPHLDKLSWGLNSLITVTGVLPHSRQTFSGFNSLIIWKSCHI